MKQFIYFLDYPIVAEVFRKHECAQKFTEKTPHKQNTRPETPPRTYRVSLWNQHNTAKVAFLTTEPMSSWGLCYNRNLKSTLNDWIILIGNVIHLHSSREQLVESWAKMRFSIRCLQRWGTFLDNSRCLKLMDSELSCGIWILYWRTEI